MDHHKPQFISQTGWGNVLENVTLAQHEVYTNWTNELSVSHLAQSHIYDKVGILINFYWFPILVPVGLFGNTLSFLVMTRKQNRQVSCCVYMAALAICDNFMLFSGVEYWSATNGVWETRQFSSLECKIGTWLNKIFSMMGTVIVILMTIDRFIAVQYPLKANIIC